MTTNAIHSTPSAHSHFMDGFPSPTSSSSELRRGSLSSNFTDDDNMTPHQMYSRSLYDHTKHQMERFANQARQSDQSQSRDFSPISSTSTNTSTSSDTSENSNNKKSKWKKIFSI